MKIGIDIDDTIAYSNESLIEEAIDYHENVLKRKCSPDFNKYRFEEMLGWTTKEKEAFFKDRMEKAISNALPKENARLIINMLYQLGYEIIIITSRLHNFSDATKTTVDWLNKNRIKYTKVYAGVENKKDIALKEKIDLFIDDIENNLNDVSSLGIPVIMFESRYNKNCQKYLKFNNWLDIYEYIMEGTWKKKEY